MRSYFGVSRVAMSVVLLVLLGASAASALGSDQDAPDNDLEQAQENELTVIEDELLDRINAMGTQNIVMHAQEDATRLAQQISSLMSSLSIETIEVRYVNQTPERAEVRIFHDADSQAGNVVADVLALVFGRVDAHDYGFYRPAPAEGLIEIWLP